MREHDRGDVCRLETCGPEVGGELSRRGLMARSGAGVESDAAPTEPG